MSHTIVVFPLTVTPSESMEVENSDISNKPCMSSVPGRASGQLLNISSSTTTSSYSAPFAWLRRERIASRISSSSIVSEDVSLLNLV